MNALAVTTKFSGMSNEAIFRLYLYNTTTELECELIRRLYAALDALTEVQNDLEEAERTLRTENILPCEGTIQ